jgi:hypothetical protein
VLKWLLGSGGANAAPEAAASRAWVGLLEKPMKKLLDSRGSKCPVRDVIDYIAEGDRVSVLAAIGQQQSGYWGGHAEGNWSEVYARFCDSLPDQGVRLARVFEALPGYSRHVFKFPNGIHWPESLLEAAHRATQRNAESTIRLPAEAFERMFAAEGLPEGTLISAAFASAQGADSYELPSLQAVRKLKGYTESLQRHLEAVRPLLGGLNGAARINAMELLLPANVETLAALAEGLAPWIATPGKQLQALAPTLVKTAGESFIPHLRELAVSAKPDQRMMALRWLHEVASKANDEALVTFAVETATADKAPSVRALLAVWEGNGESEAQPDAESTPLPPPLPEASLPVSGLLTPALRKAVEDMWRDTNKEIERSNVQAKAWYEKQVAEGNRHARLHTNKPLPDSFLRELLDVLATDTLVRPRRAQGDRGWHIHQQLQKLIATGSVDAVSTARLLDYLGGLTGNQGDLNWHAISYFNSLHRARGGEPTLGQLAAVLAHFGVNSRNVLTSYCRDNGLAGDWAPQAVAPFMANHVGDLVQMLTDVSRNNYWFSRAQLFRAIGLLDRPPPVLVNGLFDLALGTGKQDRPLAQIALAKQPNKEARIVAALADGKGEVRTVAAQWLQRLGHAEAVPALETAVAKEKNDVAKGAMLDALEAFGQPVEKYLDRAALAKEAARSLAKGLPKELDWFPWAAMPVVHWADDGEEVPVDVLKWLLVQAMKQKSPEPNAVLRKYCAMMLPREREQLGQFVLECWLREDVKPIPPEQAHAQAAAQAQSTFQAMQRSPQWFKDSPLFGRTEAELLAYILPGQLRQPAGSATGSKGLLAIAAACAGAGAAAPTYRFLKEWYGQRASQGKALIAMLGWIEHPSATQLMLSIGSRFRTKSFQEEAVRQAEQLAERKGWSLEELADRTIPSAGFDENGELELSYGARIFTGRLLPDFKLELYNPEGKKVASLPEPRADDDAELAKDAKKAWSAAKKELKGIVELQGSRLYEALCTARSWPSEDWEAYLNRHPIVRRLGQRLAWIELSPEGGKRSFRPLDDGTLTDLDDNAFHLAPGTRVCLAHESLLPADESARWLQHFEDYAVAPLFRQFGSGNFVLPANQQRDDKLEDFRGHVLESFALRGRAGKLGYQRGGTEDGGWFFEYTKRYPTLGLEAVIEFTGNGLPETNRAVALTALSFRRTGSNRYDGHTVALGKVPGVLLSESYNDIRMIAADGRGFVSDWEKVTEF